MPAIIKILDTGKPFSEGKFAKTTAGLAQSGIQRQTVWKNRIARTPIMLSAASAVTSATAAGRGAWPKAQPCR